jgi:hypothetical protein
LDANSFKIVQAIGTSLGKLIGDVIEYKLQQPPRQQLFDHNLENYLSVKKAKRNTDQEW